MTESKAFIGQGTAAEVTTTPAEAPAIATPSLSDAELEFLRGLTELTRRTGIGIQGCGCCGSPYLCEVEDVDRGSYGSRYPNIAPDECIGWQEPDEG